MKWPEKPLPAIERVRAYLRRSASAEHVVEGGVAHLVAGWERVAGEYAHGFDPLDMIYELLNDLDGRQVLGDVLREVPDAATDEQLARIKAADELVRANATLDGPCSWGPENERDDGWTRTANWWYFARPKRPGAGFVDDLPTS